MAASLGLTLVLIATCILVSAAESCRGKRDGKILEGNTCSFVGCFGGVQRTMIRNPAECRSFKDIGKLYCGRVPSGWIIKYRPTDCYVCINGRAKQFNNKVQQRHWTDSYTIITFG